MRYVFTTSRLRAPIDPVTPVDKERLVDTASSIIIDSLELLTNVTVAGVLVWDGSFQNSWTGVSLAIDGGRRLVCDPPTPLTQGSSYAVSVTSAGYSLAYSFSVGLSKITDTNDVTSPRIAEATASYAWIGYVRNNEAGLPPGIEQGNLYLRKGFPALTVETRIVPGEDAEVGYDPATNKVYVFYTRIGKVFAMTADPADLPATQLQPRTINDDVRQRLAGDGLYYQSAIVNYPPIKQGIDESVRQRLNDAGMLYKSDIVSYPPLKQAVIDNVEQRLTDEGFAYREILGPWAYVPTPVVISGYKTDVFYVIIRVSRPTGGEERSLIQGFYFVRWTTGGAHRIVGYASMPPYARSPELVDYVDLGVTDRESGVQNSYRDDGTDGENEPVTAGPPADVRNARKNKGATDDDLADRYFYFKVTDTDLKGLQNVRVVADVYDDPAFVGVPVSLQYTTFRALGPSDTAEVYYAHERVWTLGGTGLWTRLEWPISDADFRSYQNGGSDFRIDVGASRLCIARLVVSGKTDFVEFTDKPMDRFAVYSVIAVYKRQLLSDELVYSSEVAGGQAAVPTIGEQVRQRFAGQGEYFRMTTTGYDPIGP